jgi:site-specific DNA-methyltransferase (adenine-specific)
MPKIVLSDNLSFLRTMQSGSVDLIYIDPPFNTGKTQKRTRIRALRDDENGDRVGFQGKRYRTVRLSSGEFQDRFDEYQAFLEPRLLEGYRVLKNAGSFFFHIDYREVHYCKVLLDTVFGRDCFMNEIIWAYDFGARSKKRWSTKHDNILWYVKDPSEYTFNYEAMDRIPYMAPGLVTEEKARRGKTPTDVWWHTIVGTNSKERTGYPTQKPLGVLERIVKMHSRSGDLLLDYFAGSGAFGEAAGRHNRDFILVDNNPEAINTMRRRLRVYGPEVQRSAEVLEAGVEEPQPLLF